MAGFRFYKRIRVLPGLNLNITGRGISASANIPGSGLSYHTNQVRYSDALGRNTDSSTPSVLGVIIRHPVGAVLYFFQWLIKTLWNAIKGVTVVVGVIAGIFLIASIIGLVRNFLG